MKLLKTILFSMLGLFIVIVAISFVLPNSVKIQRTIEIKTKPKQAFKIVNNLRDWKLWSHWHKIDTNTIWVYDPIESGVGAKYSWKSINPELGEGELSIVESYPDSLIKAFMQFGEMGKSVVLFQFTPTSNGAEVTWIMESNVSSMPFYRQPFLKYFYLLMDQMVGPDFEKDLKNMQVILESQKPILVAEFEAEIRDFEGLNYIGIREKIKGADVGMKLNQNYGIMQEYLKVESATIKGVPFTINHSANGEIYDMTIALATENLLSPITPIQSGILKPGKWLVVKYYGGYDKMSPVYQKGFEYLAENNLKPSGAPLEFYMTDPMSEKDTALWLTELVFPYIE